MRHVPDRPGALPDGAKVLHIGLPKTGTSSLQGALHEWRDELATAGVFNASKVRHHADTGRTAAGNLDPHFGDRFVPRWEALATRFRESTARATIWSSETLSAAAPDRIRHIADRLGVDDVHVVVTLRPLDATLASAWQQGIRDRLVTRTLEEWVDYMLTATTPTVRRYNVERLLREWGAVFGEDHLIFVVGDPADHASFPRAFAALLGVPEELLTFDSLSNTSLPYPEVEMLRHFNRAYAERGGDYAHWIRTVGRRGTRGLARLTGLERRPIRLTRSLTEQCNALTREWMTAVERSGATVVGDLAHLYSDPEARPESASAPDRVSAESAGRILDVLFEVAEEPAPAAARPDLSSFSKGDLARELARRARARLRG